MVNNEPVTPTAQAEEPVQPEGVKSGTGIVRHLNIIIPSAVVLMCAVIVFFMLLGEIRYANSVQGRFVCSSSESSESCMVFERDGTYSFYEDSDSTPVKGSWEMVSGKIYLTESTSGNSDTMYYIGSKHLAFDDENFLKGKVPEKSAFDAEFTADDGTVYVFENDGTCYTSEDGRNTELGKYITDGNFIVITIEDTAHTYLNCGEGITPVFFTQS